MIHPVITLTSRSISAIGKIAQLRNLIWQQLTPKYPAAAIAFIHGYRYPANERRVTELAS